VEKLLNANAIDFIVDESASVLAAADGIVNLVKDNSDTERT
jgi:hypothetical protein